jgi:hypothetical protein
MNRHLKIKVMEIMEPSGIGGIPVYLHNLLMEIHTDFYMSLWSLRVCKLT